MKKFMAMLIACIMIVSLTATISAAEIKTEEFYSEAEFLKMLGIIDAEIGPEEKVSRASFADMLIKAINEKPAVYSVSVFTDVTEKTPYSGSIAKAYELGMISGDGNGCFFPEKPISGDAALKMAVATLGYNEISMAYGGYPTGYVYVANDIKLVRGVNISNGFSASDVYKLLYNFLMADVCAITTVKQDGTATYERDEGNNPLRMYFDLERSEGVVKTAGYASMVHGYDDKEAGILVNGTKYTTSVENAEKYLGMYVTVWYDSEGCAKAIYVNRNKIVEENSETIDSVAGNIVTVFRGVNDKGEKLILSPAYTFVKNGRVISPEESDFNEEFSDYTFIDNNNDGLYDVVLAYIPEYITVSSINIIDGMVYDTNGSEKYLLLDEDAGVRYSLARVDKEGNKVPIEMNELAENDVIKYYKSEDGTYLVGEVCNMSVSGRVSEIYEDIVVIDGKEYKVNSYFGDVSSLSFGVDYTLLLASDGTITCVAKDITDEMQYGFLTYFATLRDGFNYLTSIKILCEGNEILETELADKITLDGKTNVKKDSAEIIEKLKNEYNSQITKYQVIRFALDEENKVSKIDTANNMLESEYSPSALHDSAFGDDILTRHLYKKKVFYYGSYKVLAPNAMIGSNTIFISVPVGFNPDAAVEYEEEDFSIITTADLPSYDTLEVTMYDINKALEPAVVLFYMGISYDQEDSVSKKAIPAIVKSVTKGLNEDGEVTRIITYYQSNRSGKLPIEVDKNSTLAERDLPAPGDIIRFVENKHGEIANYVIDLRYTPASGGNSAYLSTTAQTLKGSVSNDGISYGKAYYHTSSNLLMKIMGGKASGHDYLSNIAGYKIGSGCSVMVYDSTTQTVKPATLALISDAISVGEENASLVVVKTYSQQISSIFIYK